MNRGRGQGWGRDGGTLGIHKLHHKEFIRGREVEGKEKKINHDMWMIYELYFFLSSQRSSLTCDIHQLGCTTIIHYFSAC